MCVCIDPEYSHHNIFLFIYYINQLLDICGIAFGWRLLGHAAHLGGIIFGLCYATYFQKYYQQGTKKIHQEIEAVNKAAKR